MMLVFIVLTFIPYLTPSLSPSPCGIEMCKVRCSHSVECTNISFEQDTLACSISIDKHVCPMETSNHDESLKGSPSMDCVPGSRIVVTQSNRSRCVRGAHDLDLEGKVCDRNNEGRDVKRVMAESWGNSSAVFQDLVKLGFDAGRLSKTDPRSLTCQDVNRNPMSTENDDDTDDGDMLTGTTLLYAAENGRLELFDFLVEKKCDMTAVDEESRNVLHISSEKGQLNIVKRILELGLIEKEEIDEIDKTPLLYSAVEGHKHVFEFLVQSGCDVEAVDDDGDGILNLACKRGHIDLAKHILSNKIVDKEIRGNLDRTPLMNAAESGRVKLFEMLVKDGCNTTALDSGQMNILHVACTKGRIGIVKTILSKSLVDKDSRAGHEMTPLLFAAEQGMFKIAVYLINKGCNGTLVDDSGESVLHKAAKGGHVVIAGYILSKNLVDKDCRAGALKRTPLLYSVEYRQRKMFDFLRNKDCDSRAVDKKGYTVLHLACREGYLDMVKHIISLKIVDTESRGLYGKTPLLVAVEGGSTEVVDFLVRQGCNVKAVDQYNDGVLHVAAFSGHTEIVKLILSLGLGDKDERGELQMTPVMLAAARAHEDLFKFLIDQDSNLTFVDNRGKNILHLSCVGGDVDIVKYILLENICDIESRTESQSTPLLISAENGHIEVFDFLLDQGSDITAVNQENWNVLHFASRFHNFEFLEHILPIPSIQDMKQKKDRKGRTPFDLAKEVGYHDLETMLQI